MMSTQHNNKAMADSASGKSYRWNPYGTFQKTTIIATCGGSPSSSSTVTPVPRPAPVVTSVFSAPAAASPAAHFKPQSLLITPPPMDMMSPPSFSELPYYDAPQAPSSATATPFASAMRFPPQALLTSSPANYLGASGSAPPSSNQRRLSDSFNPITTVCSSRNSDMADEEGLSSTSSSYSASAPPPTPTLSVLEHHKLVLQWVNYARSLSCDERVEAVINDLTPEVQHNMLEAIVCPADGGSKLFVDLCTNERGNVVTQLLRAVGADAVKYHEAVVSMIERHWQQLTTSQFGGIALTRLFQVLPATPYQDRLARLTLQTATTLALHQFGNFIVSEILRAAAQHPEQFGFVFDQLAAQWSQPQVFAQLAESRFGSHVLETFLKTAPAAFVLQLCAPLLTTGCGLACAARMGWHKQANYPLQAALRRLSAQGRSTAPLMSDVRDALLPRLEGSDYCRNLSRAMSCPSTLQSPPSTDHSSIRSDKKSPAQHQHRGSPKTTMSRKVQPSSSSSYHQQTEQQQMMMMPPRQPVQIQHQSIANGEFPFPCCVRYTAQSNQ